MDRENVIKVLNDIGDFIAGRIGFEQARNFLQAIDGAAALLNEQEEQEAVEPVCKIIFDIPYYFCGRCHEMLNMYSTKAMFCSKCSRPVKLGAVKD